jgi:hypothetical protein
MSGSIKGVSKVLNRHIDLTPWAVPVYALGIKVTY